MIDDKIQRKLLKEKYDSLPGFAVAVFLAIENNDPKGVEYIFGTKNPDDLFKHKASSLLALSYSMDCIAIASTLIQNQVRFNPTNLLYTHPDQLNKTLYEDHLNSLSKLISNTDYEQATGIINALSSSPILSDKQSSCFNITQVMSVKSYSNYNDEKVNLIQFYNELLNIADNSAVVMQTLILAAIGMEFYAKDETILIVPNIKNADRSAVYKPAGNFNDKNIIYMPFYKYDSHEKGVFIHELGHYAQEVLFNNNFLPYLTSEQENDYHIAVKNVVRNIIDITHSPKSVQLLHEMMTETNDRYKIAEYLSSNSFVPLFLYKTYNHSHVYIEDMFKIYSIPTSEFKIYTFQYKKVYIEKLYNKLIVDFNLEVSDLKVISRVAEALLRPDHMIDAELIVRIAELKAEKVSHFSLEVIKPLEDYWKMYISPKVISMRSNVDLPDCTICNIGVYEQIQVIGVSHDGEIT